MLPWYLPTNYANSTEILPASEKWLVHLGRASLLCTSDNAVIASGRRHRSDSLFSNNQRRYLIYQSTDHKSPRSTRLTLAQGRPLTNRSRAPLVIDRDG